MVPPSRQRDQRISPRGLSKIRIKFGKGESVPRDALYGLGWLAKAADGGDKKAQELLQRIDRALVGNRKIAERI